MSQIIFSLVLLLLCMTSSVSAAITTVTVDEKDGVTTNNYPLTFGHLFKQGDAPSNVYIKIGSTSIPTQCDVKSTYSDGSIRFAVLSILVPTVPANGSVSLSLESGGVNANTSPLTKAEIQATSIDAQIALTNISGSGYSGNLTADLSTAINDTASLQYWLSGDVATEVIIQQRLNNSLNAVWEVRLYPGTNFKRISHTIENIEANYRGNVNYSIGISQGAPSLSSVYSRRETGNSTVTLESLQGETNTSSQKLGFANFSSPHTLKVGDKITVAGASQSVLNGDFVVRIVESPKRIAYSISSFVTSYTDPGTSITLTPGTFQHNHSSKWRKVFWVGAEPPETEVHYDLSYLISTGMIPNYDTSLSPSEATIAGTYAAFTTDNSDIGGNGFVNFYFPSTSGRPEIGFFPTWAARYLTSFDNRMKEIMLRQADIVAGCPIHYREFDTAKDSAGPFVNIDDRPKVRTTTDFANNASYDALGASIGDVGTQWTVDGAHQGSFNFVPYVITGEYYYLQEMQYWAAWDLSMTHWDTVWGRNLSEGVLKDQIRGTAWMLRNVAHAALLSLDGSAEKAYFTNKIENNIPYWAARTVENPLRNLSMSDGAPSGTVASVIQTTSGWMEDFVLIVLNEIDRFGFDTESVVSEYSKFVINRFSNPGFNFYLGASYRFPTVVTGPSNVSSWVQANSLYTVNDASSWGVLDYTFSYRHIALAALSGVTNRENGKAAYDWLKDNINTSVTMDDDPTWAIIPLTAFSHPITNRIKITAGGSGSLGSGGGGSLRVGQ